MATLRGRLCRPRGGPSRRPVTSRVPLQQSVRRASWRSGSTSCEVATRDGGSCSTTWPDTSQTSTSTTPAATRSAYSGGLFWHTNHYEDAGIATHRTYDPRRSWWRAVRRTQLRRGVGPSLLSDGLHSISRDAATGLARWVIRMDEGHRTCSGGSRAGLRVWPVLRGRRSITGPAGPAANSIVACLQGHRLSADRSLLEKAEGLIRRCIHPSDDVPARQLFEVEKRWYYTVFSQALGEYLDYKQELGEDDRMCAWARESLLTYARWMASHETALPDRAGTARVPERDVGCPGHQKGGGSGVCGVLRIW